MRAICHFENFGCTFGYGVISWGFVDTGTEHVRSLASQLEKKKRKKKSDGEADPKRFKRFKRR